MNVYGIFVGISVLMFGTTQQAYGQGIETVTYDTAQRLVCLRDGEVGLDRPAAFRLKVVKYPGGEDYSYRDGSWGGRPGKFSIRTDQVTCTATPTEGPASDPVREFNEVSELTCADSGILIVQPVLTEKVIERGSDNALIYEYWLHDGPPSKQTVTLSPMGGVCNVRPLD